MNYFADKDKNPSAITLLQNLQRYTETLQPISFFLSLFSFLVKNLQMGAHSNKGSLSWLQRWVMEGTHLGVAAAADMDAVLLFLLQN